MTLQFSSGSLGELNKVLTKVRELVDFEVLQGNIERQRDAWLFKSINQPPLTLSFPPPIPIHDYTRSEIFEDPIKMLVNELETSVYPHLIIKDDATPSLRADYGIVIIPASFGCQINVPENDMPWITSRVFGEGKPDPDKMDEPSFVDGLPSKVLETERFFLDKLKDTGIHVYLADTQGPFNICHHLMGESIFIAAYRYPNELKEILSKIVDAYVKYSELQKRVIGEPLDEGAHGWDRSDGPSGIWMGRGGVRLCDDSAALLSPRHYKEFCVPFNSRCLEPFGGGMWHSCGRVSHLLPAVVGIKGVRAVTLGNPEMHIFQEVRRMTFEKGICLVWKEILQKNSEIDKFVHKMVEALQGEYRGIIFSLDVSSLEEAEKLKLEWQKAFSKIPHSY
jgi:hypothetical protein